MKKANAISYFGIFTYILVGVSCLCFGALAQSSISNPKIYCDTYEELCTHPSAAFNVIIARFFTAFCKVECFIIVSLYLFMFILFLVGRVIFIIGEKRLFVKNIILYLILFISIFSPIGAFCVFIVDNDFIKSALAVYLINIPPLLFILLNARYLFPNILPKNKFSSFENRVYMPTYFTVVSSFMSGYIIFNYGYINVSNYTKKQLYFLFIMICFEFFLVAFHFFVKRIKTRYVHIFFPILVILVSFVLSMIFFVEESALLMALYSLTYMLGLLEAFKHIYFVQKEGNLLEKRELFEIYLPASNWSAATIPVGTLLLPFMFPGSSHVPLVIVNIIVCLTWMYTKKSWKLSTAAPYWYSWAFFALTILGYSASVARWGGDDALRAVIGEKPSDVFWITSIITVISIVGISITLIRFFKDILGLKLQFYAAYMYSRDIYKGFVGGFMLNMFSIMFICLFLMLFWIATVTYLPASSEVKASSFPRLLVSCIAALSMGFVNMTLFFLAPGVRENAVIEAHKIGEARDPSARKASSK